MAATADQQVERQRLLAKYGNSDYINGVIVLPEVEGLMSDIIFYVERPIRGVLVLMQENAALVQDREEYIDEANKAKEVYIKEREEYIDEANKARLLYIDEAIECCEIALARQDAAEAECKDAKAATHVLQGKNDGLTRENHELKRNQKRLPAAAAAAAQVDKKQCHGLAKVECLNPTDCEKCLKEPKDKFRRRKWKDMRNHYNLMQPLTQEQIKSVIKKNGTPPEELDVLYKKEAKCIKASELMKLAPEGASERWAKERKNVTTGILCPNCFQKYLMSNV